MNCGPRRMIRPRRSSSFRSRVTDLVAARPCSNVPTSTPTTNCGPRSTPRPAGRYAHVGGAAHSVYPRPRRCRRRRARGRGGYRPSERATRWRRLAKVLGGFAEVLIILFVLGPVLVGVFHTDGLTWQIPDGMARRPRSRSDQLFGRLPCRGAGLGELLGGRENPVDSGVVDLVTATDGARWGARRAVGQNLGNQVGVFVRDAVANQRLGDRLPTLNGTSTFGV